MTAQVVVLGSGYAGAGAINSLEAELGDEADITWISDVDYHLVLHEVHRCIKDPSVQEQITVPVDAIKSADTRFLQGTVTDVDTDTRTVVLEDDRTVDYDYLLIGIGSRTAFFGIEGLREHAHTLKSLDDALAIHDAVTEAGREATKSDPAEVVVGGAGLSGIQVAGEVAEYREKARAPIDITLVEGLDNILPESDPELQGALRSRLEARDVQIETGEFIGEVDAEKIYVGDDAEMSYDVLVWTGGITGREAMQHVALDKDERSNRVRAETTFQTDDERVFAIGDAALVDQNGEPAPPTAQAAWQAAELVGENIARQMRGQPLKPWKFKDKGTAISIGEEAVAHDVMLLPISTFGGLPAKLLKKAIAVRWIADVSSIRRALRAWPDM